MCLHTACSAYARPRRREGRTDHLTKFCERSPAKEWKRWLELISERIKSIRFSSGSSCRRFGFTMPARSGSRFSAHDDQSLVRTYGHVSGVPCSLLGLGDELLSSLRELVEEGHGGEKQGAARGEETSFCIPPSRRGKILALMSTSTAARRASSPSVLCWRQTRSDAER